MAIVRNLATAKTTADITSSATSIPVNRVDVFGESQTTLDRPFYVTIMPVSGDEPANSTNSEIALVTGISGSNLTVTRAQRNTTAKAFSAGAIVTNGIYAEDAVFLSDEEVTSGSSYRKQLVDKDGNRINPIVKITVDAALSTTSTDPVQNKVVTQAINDANALIENKISYGDVQTSDIATGAVTNIKIGNGAVTANKIAAGAVTSAKLGLTSSTLPSITWASGIVSGSSGFQGLVYADLVLINNAYVARSTTAWNTSWQNIGTLPEGYRPKTQTIFPAIFTNLDTGNMTGYGRVRFNTSGVIDAKANGTASNSYCCFSGVFTIK